MRKTLGENRAAGENAFVGC